MKREIFFSIILHLVIFVLAFVSTPFGSSKPFDYDQVIKIKAISFPQSQTPSAAVSPTVPQAIPEEPIDIPVTEPKSISKPVKTDKPKEKPKPKTETTKKPKTETENSQTQAGGGSGEKQIDQANTSGSPFGGATIDNASFDYPYWFTLAFNKIASNWRQTVVIDGSVVCVVYFQVIKSGRVIDVKLKESSGVPAFDETCLLAVDRSAPFPPLPQDFSDEIIGITLPFKYEPR